MRSINAIKKKYGDNAFVTWGRRGGSPILRNHRLIQAIKEKRVKIIPK